MSKCDHKDFVSQVSVYKIEDNPPHVYVEVTVKCLFCEAPVLFNGLPGGLSPMEPSVSVDQLEVRLPGSIGAGL